MLTLIVNPVAGNGRALSACEGVQAILRERGIDFAVRETKKRGHATKLSREACEAGEGVVCVGGDGTLYEVVNGFGERVPDLYFVPSGTGNDFARALHLPKDPVEAFRAQLDGEPVLIDKILLGDGAFVNESGAGFDVEVLRQTERFKANRRGLLPYLMGVCATVKRFRPFDAVLTVDGVREETRLTILSVANGQYIGGGMRVAPTSDMRDGLIELITVCPLKRWQVPFLFPFFIPGWYVKLPIARVRRCRELTVESKGMTVNADGELLPMDVARYRVAPGCIRLHLPKRKS